MGDSVHYTHGTMSINLNAWLRNGWSMDVERYARDTILVKQGIDRIIYIYDGTEINRY